ncbi:hypothetical protein Tter_0634 [Thermobaculum terrenum ATCC BAA-798]|uniref:DUF4268 domain-containing protein n=1 Tax=Thermobaculum terrenum (strain ATCC BAA-798 / CCMEE 7001 / YNP1) TaxID=525904 RepID=D1CF45_THET1|nr:DUF4268 domain-containing protein [Thermobaculum terrenum]ACZ41551.1 hypothetical protein Tter_0634 [Thermobaculum terrenum ATCC BAA-798]
MHLEDNYFAGNEIVRIGSDKLASIRPVSADSLQIDEQDDLNPWISRDENLRLLSDVVGIDLASREVNLHVGEYLIDVLAVDRDSGNIVLIENQIATSDDTHLGKLMTCAALLGSRVLIWVCTELKDQHKKTLDFLNGSSPDLMIFGVEMQFLRIGDSLPAPVFRLTVKPSSKTGYSLRSHRLVIEEEQDQGLLPARDRPALAQRERYDHSSESEHTYEESNQYEQLDYQGFWMEFNEYCRQRGVPFTLQDTRTREYSIPLDRDGFEICLIASPSRGRCICELRIKKEDAWKTFQLLQQDKGLIERIAGALEWNLASGGTEARISIETKDVQLEERDRWIEAHAWLRHHSEVFYKIFAPRVKMLAFLEQKMNQPPDSATGSSQDDMQEEASY